MRLPALARGPAGPSSPQLYHPVHASSIPQRSHHQLWDPSELLLNRRAPEDPLRGHDVPPRRRRTSGRGRVPRSAGRPTTVAGDGGVGELLVGGGMPALADVQPAGLERQRSARRSDGTADSKATEETANTNQPENSNAVTRSAGLGWNASHA